MSFKNRKGGRMKKWLKQNYILIILYGVIILGIILLNYRMSTLQ